MGALGMAICLDETENTVACTDPSCKYGDCGSTDWQQVGGPLCLDHAENQIPCSNPGCTYGDCLPSTPAPKPGVIAVPQNVTNQQAPILARPANTISVPLSPSSLGLWFTGSTFGLPNWALGIGVIALTVGLASGGGRRR